MIYLHYRSLPVLSGLLKNDDLGVRTAAGEAIALLYELTDSSASAEDDADDEVPQSVSITFQFSVTSNSYTFECCLQGFILQVQFLVGSQLLALKPLHVPFATLLQTLDKFIVISLQT